MSNGKPQPKPQPEQKTKVRPIWGPRPLEAVAGGFLFAAGAFLFDKVVGLFSSSSDSD